MTHQGTLQQALKDLTDRLMSKPGVLGTAEAACDGRPCLKVFVGKRSGGVRRHIPDSVDGYPVVVEETDWFRPL